MIDRADDGAAPFDSDVTGYSPGTRTTESVGPYRLLERVGEGGMGEVWLAEQMRPVHRQVALKVIKAGMDSAHVVARFEAERQALALMNHPAIARVFDAGTTPEGRPFFVMEYVRGEAITAYVTRHKLSIRDRIELLIRVCEGVQHAHQKGIIHRDLKPSNVLVTIRDDHPEPKIIDFGVAKATTQTLTERTLHTEIGALVGTPEYMSPEQVEMSGLDIDTRADVYALGVIFYELLTGTLPFEASALREKGLDEIRRTIREVDPPRPSTRVTTVDKSADAASRRPVDAARLASQLRGDLDWITMKALEKDRTRRYASVGELAADLQRHLENQPVLASPPSTTYRLRKFVRRNRLAISATATVVMLLVIFAAAMAVQARRIAVERDRANREAETAKQVSAFLVSLFRVSDPSESRGSTLTARELLDKGARDVERLHSEPAVQGRLKATIGEVYTSLGLYSAAEGPLKEAISTLRTTVGADDPATLAAVVQLANLYWYMDRTRDAEPLYLDVVQQRRRVLGPEHRDTLRAQFDLASLYLREKRWEEAEKLAKSTLDAQQRVLGAGDPDSLSSMNNIGGIYWGQGRYAEALPIYTQVRDIRLRQLGADHPLTLLSVHNLATEYDQLGRDTEAEALYREALEGKRRVQGETHDQTLRTQRRLALLYQKLHRYAEAEPLFLGMYRAHADTLGAEHPNTQAAAKSLVELYEAWGRPSAAAEWRSKLSSGGKS